MYYKDSKKKRKKKTERKEARSGEQTDRPSRAEHILYVDISSRKSSLLSAPTAPPQRLALPLSPHHPCQHPTPSTSLHAIAAHILQWDPYQEPKEVLWQSG